MEKQIFHQICTAIDTRTVEFETMSNTIWGYAEPAYCEHQSAKLQMDFLKNEGFRITTPIGGIDTAFIAEYGSGKPVIAILGEYDALPGLSQEADKAEEAPIPGAAAGHGCGHNLLGTAAVEAVCAVKAQMDAGELTGTIRYYGCPAEEGGGGKVFMVRAGAFDDVDIAISWHPSDRAGFLRDFLAVVIAKFRFEGKTAHAAAFPYEGRSALDAAELMNVGAQFLREHVTSDVRIHYAFLDVGGKKANVVQKSAELLYVVRADDMDKTRDVFRRINLIAKGAAMMTETTVSEPVIKGAYANLVHNEVLAGICKQIAAEIYPAVQTAEEKAYGEKFAGVIRGAQAGYDEGFYEYGMDPGSTDFADVSWVVPSIAVATATHLKGTVLHNWAATAQGKSEGAHRGMHMAAKLMAGCAAEVFKNPELAKDARAEFDRRLNGRHYESLLPKVAKPNALK